MAIVLQQLDVVISRMACATNIQSALLGILSQQIKKKQKEKFLVNDHCEKSK
jgi:hypothetical protein